MTPRNGSFDTAPLRMGDLVAMAHLGLTLLAGRAGLERPVRWAHVCELEDPSPWLEGGELVMTTGMGVPPGGREQALYVERMAEANLAGLAISQDLLAPPISDRLLEAADRTRFPVVTVSIEVPFVALSRTIASANSDAAQRRLVTHLGIFDMLRAAVSEGAAFPDLLARMEPLVGYSLSMCSPTGRPLLDGVPVPPGDVMERHLPRQPGQQPGIPGGYIVTIPVAGRNVGVLVALDLEDAEPAGLTAVQHIATVVALELTNREREREVVRREGAETLAELLGGSLETAAARKRVSLAGLDPDRPVTLAAIALDDGVDDSAVHHELADSDVPHLLLAQRELFVLIPTEAVDVFDHIAGCRVGISRSFLIDDGTAAARREALWALARAKDRIERIAHFPDQETDATWLPIDTPSLAALVQRILGDVLEADSTRGSEFVRSLRVWLEYDRRTEAAANRLLIHKHTLAYRLKRVEQLTGRSLSSTGDLAELWWALRALDVIGSARDAGPSDPSLEDG
jgi:purine catabolism regulator